MDLDLFKESTFKGRIGHALSSVVLALAFLCLMPSYAYANDNFPGTTITGISGSLTASNTSATSQAGEPTTYGGGSLNSMWYSWTAPSSGTFTVQTCGGSTNFDTTLKTYTGTAVNSLSTVAANDDNCALQSVNTVSVTAGTTYRIQVDGYGSNTGTFTLSWNFVGTDFADLSLAKTVSNASPTSGSTVEYTLTVSSASSSTQTASGISVTDFLPAGVNFVTKVSGDGTYNAGTGIWTLANSIAPNSSRNIVLRVTVTAPAGSTVTNVAEIRTSSQPDPDSVVDNGSISEDDYTTRAFTVAGTRSAGTPPTLICPAGSTLFDWGTRSWPSSSAVSQSQSYSVTNIGTVTFNVDTDGVYLSPLEINGSNNGGITGETGLYQYIDYSNRTEDTTTVMTLPTAVPGLQFRVFDVDFANNDFADLVTVMGSFNGSPVTPVLTNGISNYVAGNSAYGDQGATNTTADGTIWVTFTSPVDQVTINYGNHASAPANPDGQAATIHDITLCNPIATLSVTKISSVISDGVSATNPKAIPGATVQYCILVTNAGSATATNIAATDVMPANVTYVTGTMRTGTNCASAVTVEDENATGADEGDPFGMSVAGTTVAGVAPSLAPSANMALVFNATVN